MASVSSAEAQNRTPALKQSSTPQDEAELVPPFIHVCVQKRPLNKSGLFGKYDLCLKRRLFVEHFVSRIKGGWCITVACAPT